MKLLTIAIALLVVAACSSQKNVTSADAEKSLKQRYEAKIGSATKTELVQEFGNPEWCRDNDMGGETCRFYKKLDTKWMGPTTDRKNYSTYDEVVADFDTNGVLQKYDAKAQR